MKAIHILFFSFSLLGLITAKDGQQPKHDLPEILKSNSVESVSTATATFTSDGITVTELSLTTIPIENTFTFYSVLTSQTVKTFTHTYVTVEDGRTLTVTTTATGSESPLATIEPTSPGSTKLSTEVTQPASLTLPTHTPILNATITQKETAPITAAPTPTPIKDDSGPLYSTEIITIPCSPDKVGECTASTTTAIILMTTTVTYSTELRPSKPCSSCTDIVLTVIHSSTITCPVITESVTSMVTKSVAVTQPPASTTKTPKLTTTRETTSSKPTQESPKPTTSKESTSSKSTKEESSTTTIKESPKPVESKTSKAPETSGSSTTTTKESPKPIESKSSKAPETFTSSTTTTTTASSSRSHAPRTTTTTITTTTTSSPPSSHHTTTSPKIITTELCPTSLPSARFLTVQGSFTSALKINITSTEIVKGDKTISTTATRYFTIDGNLWELPTGNITFGVFPTTTSTCINAKTATVTITETPKASALTAGQTPSVVADYNEGKKMRVRGAGWRETA